MVLPVRKFAGSEVVKEQIKRLFALYARLLTDDGGQDAIPQELLRRLSLVKGDHAKLPRKPEGCYGTAAAIYAAGGEKQRIDFGVFIQKAGGLFVACNLIVLRFFNGNDMHMFLIGLQGIRKSCDAFRVAEDVR